jgi:hypothetical protein
MKKIFAFLFFISLMCGFAFAQSSFPELEIAKEIKLLRSTRSDVRLIMSEFDSYEKISDDDEDEDDEGGMSEFWSDNAKVRVYYSSGGCSKDPDDGDAPQWDTRGIRATKVVVVFNDTVKLKDLGLNLSGFKKRLEREDAADDEDSIFANDFIYHDEKAGILITAYDDEVGEIILHPPFSRLCKNEVNSEIFSGETSFVNAITRSVIFCRLSNYPAKVTNLDLKTNGAFGCQDEKCIDAKKEISVTTTAFDYDDDTLGYKYIVTGGKIIGSGANVIWDLTGVKPGTYSITAGVDDSCGICGETKTQEISLNENSYEFTPPAKIEDLILDKTELIAACPVGRLQKVRCASGNCGISIISVTPKGKNLTYKYEVYGGKIIGSGEKVTWDLANLKPGEYRIEVSASDDGTVFGEPKTATVVIKENPSCTVPKK